MTTSTIPLPQLRHELDTARTHRRHAARTLRRTGRRTNPSHATTAATARALRNLTCADAHTTQLEALINARTQ